MGVTSNNDGDEWTYSDDSVFGVVAEPFENGNNQIGAGAGVAHCRKDLGVKQARHAVRDVEIHPTDGDAIPQSRDALVLNE